MGRAGLSPPWPPGSCGAAQVLAGVPESAQPPQGAVPGGAVFSQVGGAAGMRFSREMCSAGG